MKRADFRVTFEIITPESAAEGDAAERGFISEGSNLRDALDEMHSTRTSRVDGVDCIEADESPLRDPRSVTIYNGMEFETGATESRSLHFPDNLTAATRRRIARIAGVRVP